MNIFNRPICIINSFSFQCRSLKLCSVCIHIPDIYLTLWIHSSIYYFFNYFSIFWNCDLIFFYYYCKLLKSWESYFFLKIMKIFLKKQLGTILGLVKNHHTVYRHISNWAKKKKVRITVLNATFNNISVISWQSV